MKFWSKRRSSHSKMRKAAFDSVLGANIQTSGSSEAVQIWLNNSPQQTRASHHIPGQRLVPSKSLPRLSVSSVSSEESWHRPNVRILHDDKENTYVQRNNSFTRSIDEVFQGPLYKEIIYSSVNMHSNESLNQKEHKESVFKCSPTPVHKLPSKASKDISALGSPSSVKSFSQLTVRPRPKGNELERTTKTEVSRQSPIGSPAVYARKEPTYTRISRIGKLDSANCPMCRSEVSSHLKSGVKVKALSPSVHQTSTPKASGCALQCQGTNKSVHFSSVVLSPIVPGSPPGYRPPPVGSCENRLNIESPKSKSPVRSAVNETSQLNSDSKTVDNRPASSPSPVSFTDPTVVPDDSLLRQYLTMEVDSCLTKGTAVHHWLKDVRLVTESECLSVLQAKSLVADPSRVAALSIRNAQTAVLGLRNRTDLLMIDFKNTISSLRLRPWVQFCTEATQLFNALQEIIQDYRSGSLLALDTTKSEIRLKRASEDLLDFIERNRDHWVSEERRSSVKQTLASMQECFKEVSEHLIMQELKVIVGALDEATNEYNLKVALAAITTLAQNGEPVCELITKSGAIRSLLSVCVENKWNHLKAATLRALTIICCVPDAVQQIEEDGGIDCITDALCESSQDENIRSEAAGLLAQITSPWMKRDEQTYGRVMKNIDPLVKALTHMAWKTDSSEVLLLSSAALANLSFLDKEACHWMSRHDSPRVLVEACKNKLDSIFIKDQVSTVLANMAAVDSCRSSLICGNAAVLLLCFLQVRPSPLHSSAELEACERLQQKAAIALARLCSETKMASTVAAMQGVKRLVRICKDEKERNNSDSVLVAALTALRKIASVCGTSEFKTLNAEDLVLPPLMDSFRLYCSKQESFV